MLKILGISVVLLSSLVLLGLFKFFRRIWWVPMRIKYAMNSQGVKGPPYRFIHGNTKEISSMTEKSMSMPMDISHDIFPRVQPHFDSWFRIYGKNFLYWYGPEAELVITEPELVKEIMNDRDVSMTKPDMGSHLKKLVGDGLVASVGEKWAKQRKLANHAFHAERLKNMVPAMIESVEMMLKRWKDMETKEMEVYAEFRILTSDVISRTAFGCSYLEGKQAFQMLRELSSIVGSNMYKMKIPGFGKMFKDKDDVQSDKLEYGIRKLIMETIRSKEKMIATGDEGGYGTDFLGLLLKAHHNPNENYHLSIQDIVDDCKTFYIAGHGATSLLLSWVCLLLGIHTDWQERAREEVLQVFGNQNPHSEGITRLKAMGMIINETVRLYPPGTSVVRKVQREVRLGNLVLPANMNVHVPVLALQHNAELWGKDAHLFKPERFSEGISKATKNNPAAFVPFGFGPRICVGSNFAINETKITLSMILQRYRFTVSPNYVHSPVQLLSLRPKSGVQIMFHAL